MSNAKKTVHRAGLSHEVLVACGRSKDLVQHTTTDHEEVTCRDCLRRSIKRMPEQHCYVVAKVLIGTTKTPIIQARFLEEQIKPSVKVRKNGTWKIVCPEVWMLSQGLRNPVTDTVEKLSAAAIKWAQAHLYNIPE